MVLQRMNYNVINGNEEEDVTPVDGSISKAASRPAKAIAVIGGGCLLLAIITIAYSAWRYSYMQHHSVLLYQTSRSKGDRMTLLNEQGLQARGFGINKLSFGNVDCSKKLQEDGLCSPLGTGPVAKISVNSNKKYQKIIGFGGSFTEAAAYNFYRFPKLVQEKILELYYGDSGIGYTLGRVHINSCDFSLKSYSFDEIDGDFSLQYFDTEVTHDNAQMLPMMRAAIQKSKRDINILASPWSPPAWMKKPDSQNKKDMVGSAQPNGLSDDPRIHAAWANYISKFITSYTNKGVPIWAITPQNEPEFVGFWESCASNSTHQRDWIQDYLGPVIKQDHPNVLILAFDHNKDHLYKWAQTVMNRSPGEEDDDDDDSTTSDSKNSRNLLSRAEITKKRNYVDGMAFHWYAGGNDRLMDGTYGYDAINKTYHLAPSKILLATEGCSCPGVKIDSWLRAERLGHDVLFDLMNYAQGWIDWNLIVDSSGGPNHLGNNCDAPIVANVDYSDVHIQPKYYYFGHISKHVTPGSVRVSSSYAGDFGFVETDPNTREGTEVGAFTCEKSTRQVWKLNANNSISLVTAAATDIDTEGQSGDKVYLCLGEGVVNRPYLRLVRCDGAGVSGQPAKALRFQWTSHQQLQDVASGKCVSLADGVSEPGALLQLVSCGNNKNIAPSQVFKTSVSGELKSKSADLCITAGWPMLYAVAFENDQKNNVIVIMNEADIHTEILLQDFSHGDIRFGINGRSMQTLVY